MTPNAIIITNKIITTEECGFEIANPHPPVVIILVVIIIAFEEVLESWKLLQEISLYLSFSCNYIQRSQNDMTDKLAKEYGITQDICFLVLMNLCNRTG